MAPHDPDDQWQGYKLVDPDHRDVGVIQPHVAEVDQERDYRQQFGREAEAKKGERDRLARRESCRGSIFGAVPPNRSRCIRKLPVTSRRVPDGPLQSTITCRA